MIYRWTTKAPTMPGQYRAMMGGCVPVTVIIDHEYEPRCVEDESAETNPLLCWWKGQIDGRPEKLTERTAICWLFEPEPPIPEKYWREWRFKKPDAVELAEITRSSEF